jgi:tyrosine-protein kinase Etk/Wzc
MPDTPLAIEVKKQKAKGDPHMMDYLTMMARHRTAVVGFTLVFGVLFFAFTFVMRFTFSSTATLLPPEKQQLGGLMSFLAGSGALDIMKTQENPALDLFQNVLESRTLAEEVARDPRIIRYFSAWDTSQKSIAGAVQRSMQVDALRNGMMTVTIDMETHWSPDDAEKDSAKVLSAYLANKLVATLDNFNRERLMTSARNTRVFVEGEYKKRMQQLDTAYASMQNFQQKNKAVSLPDQLSATVTAAAELGASIQQMEIQLSVEERELSPNSDRIQTLRAQLQAAKRALAGFDDGSVGDYVVGLKGVPQLARQFAGLTREIKLLETLTAYLRQQWEQEKINEQRNLPSLQVLDPAIPPDRKSSPKRLAMLLLGLSCGFVASIVYVGVQRFRSLVKIDRFERRRFINFMHALRHGKNAKFDPVAGPEDIEQVAIPTANVRSKSETA